MDAGLSHHSGLAHSKWFPHSTSIQDNKRSASCAFLVHICEQDVRLGWLCHSLVHVFACWKGVLSSLVGCVFTLCVVAPLVSTSPGWFGMKIAPMYILCASLLRIHQSFHLPCGWKGTFSSQVLGSPSRTSWRRNSPDWIQRWLVSSLLILDLDSTNERTSRKVSTSKRKDLDEKAPMPSRSCGPNEREDSIGCIEKVHRTASTPVRGDVRGHGDVHGAREGMQDVQERRGGREEDKCQPKDPKRWEGTSTREETGG